MRILAWLLLAIPGCLSLLQFARAEQESLKWNVLLVTADDMNADSAGWMGQPLKPTPNLDAFARSAHRFLNSHVSAPICQPSRSALMTSRVPHRSGALGFDPVRPGTPTLVTRLRDAGWFTAVIEKHVHMQPDSSFPWDLKLSGSGKNPTAFGRQVAECLAAAQAAGKPFFLNANITDPHRPFIGSEQASKQKKNKQATSKSVVTESSVVAPEQVTVPSFLEELPEVRREVAEYFTSIRRFDQSFGEMMQALEQSGHANDTLVVFMSDHGMSFPFSKASVYRNGTWSPVLVRWPGMGAPQSRTEWVSSLDIMPAILELLKLPPQPDIDGRSWVPLLQGQSQSDRDYVITHVNTVSSGKSFPQRCVRTDNFSYQFHAWADGENRFRVEAMNGRSYNAMAEAAKTDSRIKSRVDQFVIGTPEQFFDLRNDLDERHNRLTDPQFASEVRRLRAWLLAHMERTGDPELSHLRQAIEQSAVRQSP